MSVNDDREIDRIGETRPTWAKFKRTTADRFFGCVDRDGTWFDSSGSFDVAVTWCAYNAGRFDLKTREEELEWMTIHGSRLGLSVIHSDMLERMYEAGLIK